MAAQEGVVVRRVPGIYYRDRLPEALLDKLGIFDNPKMRGDAPSPFGLWRAKEVCSLSGRSSKERRLKGIVV